MSHPRSTAAEEDPTPDPSSAVVESGGKRLVERATTPDEGAYLDACVAAVDEAKRLYGGETTDAWFAALADGTHPLCRIATPGSSDTGRPRIREADLVSDPAMLEAAERYAGDTTHERELEDLRAGRHPLQRVHALST